MNTHARVPLGEVCTIVGGGTPRRSNPTYFGGAIPWATPTDVTALDSLFIERTKETITELGLGESSARLLPAGTVLMTSRATIGYTAITTRPMATNQGFANLICSEHVMPEYLAYWLRHQRERLIQLAGGTTFRELPKSTLKNVLIPLPPLDEQRRIVGVLNRAAQIERLRVGAQERLREFIPALFAKMFGDPVENPMGWEVAALGDLCDVNIGRTPPRKESRYWGGTHPWATIRDLDGSTLMSTAQGITDDAVNEVMPIPVEPDTLLFSFKLSIGKMAFAGRSMYHNEAIAALPIRNCKALDREFLFYALKAKTHEEGANDAVLGKVLNKRKVEEIQIPLPPLDRQRRFAEVAGKAQAAVARADAGTRTASSLTASLLSRLLEDGA